MNLNRFIRHCLLLLFVLLQCVAPFAHAHVNGNSTDHNIHLAEIDSAWLNDHGLNNHESNHHDSGHHDAGTTQLANETEHAVVVCMPPECRGSELLIAQPIAVYEQRLFAARQHGVLSFAAPPRQILSSTPYQHPYSQAPPA